MTSVDRWKVVVSAPYARPCIERYRLALEQVPLERVLREADIISLNCTLNPSSFHLIDRAALAAMKPEAFLINTCRGPVVEEPALEERS